VKQNITYKYHK